MLVSERKLLKTTKIGRISYAAWSGITNGESIEWSATKIAIMIGIYWRLQIFYDPDLLSSYDVPTFLIKLLLPQVQESLAAMLECREIHERIWVSPETLSIVNMLDEILVNHTMIQEIWRHCWRLWEKNEIENSGSEEPLQSIPLPCYSVRAKREKSLCDKQVSCLWLTMPWVLGLDLKAWQFRFISPRRCICKIPWPNGISKLDRELPSRSLRKSEESRARIAVNQENRSNQLAEGHHQSKINYRKRFRWLWRNGFDDGGRNEMKLRYCLFDLRNYQAWSRDKTKRAKNSYTEQKKVFSGRQLGLVQEETLVVLDTHATGDREDNVGWSGETQEKSHPEQEYSSVPKVKETDCRKSLNSPKASPVTEAENSLSMVGKMKIFVVWLSTSSRVSRCIHGYRRSWLSSDGKSNLSTRSRRRYSRSSCYSNGKKSPRLCISGSDPMNSILRKVEELGLNGKHQKILRCTWYKTEFGREKGNLEALSKKVNLMSEILARPVLRRNTWGNLTTSRLYQQSSVEFGEKICKLKAEDNYVLFSCEGARDTEDRMFIVDSGASMHNAEQGRLEHRNNGHFEKVQNTISDLPRPEQCK